LEFLGWRPMNAADFQSGHDRRHNDPPNLWLAVLAGSLVVHLLLLLSGRLFLFRVNSQKSAGVMAPIELVDISPKSSNKTTRSTRSSAPKVATSAAASQRAVNSEATPQPAAPIQPSIVQQPIPSPIPQPSIVQQPIPSPTPQVKPSVKPTIVAATPRPQLPFVKVRPTAPQPVVPEQPSFPTSEPRGANTGDRPTSLDANSAISPGSADPNNNPSAVPDSSTNDSGKEPSTLGPIGSDQSLPSTEVTILAQVAAGQIRRAGLSGDSFAKTAQLKGNEQQQITIPYSPDLKLLPGQILNLEAQVTVDTTNGKVINATVPVNPTSMSSAELDRLVNKVFEPLLFDVIFDTTDYNPVNKAPLTAWVVPVQIQVVK